MNTFCVSFMDESWRAAESSQRHSPLIRQLCKNTEGSRKKTGVAGPQDFMVDPASVLYLTYLYILFCYMYCILIDSIRYTDFGSSIYHINIYGHIRLLLFFFWQMLTWLAYILNYTNSAKLDIKFKVSLDSYSL